MIPFISYLFNPLIYFLKHFKLFNEGEISWMIVMLLVFLSPDILVCFMNSIKFTNINNCVFQVVQHSGG